MMAELGIGNSTSRPDSNEFVRPGCTPACLGAFT